MFNINTVETLISILYMRYIITTPDTSMNRPWEFNPHIQAVDIHGDSGISTTRKKQGRSAIRREEARFLSRGNAMSTDMAATFPASTGIHPQGARHPSMDAIIQGSWQSSTHPQFRVGMMHFILVGINVDESR